MRTELVLPTHVVAKVPDAILPVEYTAAVNAIAKCRTIDDAKFWSDKSDALAAWAKIYQNAEAEKEAKRLKLHAFRRMNDLANEIQPRTYLRGPGTKGKAQQDGPRALLRKHGLSETQAQHIRRIGQIPQPRFDALISSDKPPGITKASTLGRGALAKARTSAAWRELVDGRMTGSISLTRFVRAFCQHQSAKDLAHGLLPGEVKAARKLCAQAMEWLDEFERFLPRDLPDS